MEVDCAVHVYALGVVVEDVLHVSRQLGQEQVESPVVAHCNMSSCDYMLAVNG